MRILCLHGYGTSGAILRSQLDAIISQADPSYEFVFLDGEYECPPARGLRGSISSPTLCFNKAFGPDEIESSLEHLDDFIETDGPFDGILGFSQGGSLALSYLLRDAGTTTGELKSSSSSSSSPSYPSSMPASSSLAPSSTPSSSSSSPFKFAIFLSTIVAFSPQQGFAADLLTRLTTNDRFILQGFPHHSETRDYSSMSGPPERALFFESLGLVLDKSLSGGFIAPDTDLGLDSTSLSAQQSESGIEAESTPAPASEQASTFSETNSHAVSYVPRVPRLIHPAILAPSHRVRIPTVHIVGHRDEPALIALSRLMEQVCDPSLVRHLVHDGAHDVPRSLKDVRAFWTAVEWAVGLGQRVV
ncbi:hypothetical protein A1O3_01770 [Capronia epimyces CBS 606.96]|uniref:Serine hydrolase domain-containing protein n=1 Tax=Capronia epimyces CBS 606.96 TaxID=1182542 RepID=W9YKW3_9EURO|nr:uncharacterized protein A1O3_01770 [Capronia epimyces CBS 606.96]EXJ93213.1 hypothetical protein A1O3_01770 [Capronia epimyces CBS 606.96]